MQSSIDKIFESIFKVLIDFLSGTVSDPGMRWGLAIVLFTVLFNLIVFPLNWKALKSSKKMSAIQPELKKIQEKYKNDPQKLQMEQSKLMKENGVSMFGGCLPMLIQWPLFIALFNIFRRLASDGTLSNLKFTPLINDLSAQKNIPLTILTVLTMWLSTWLTQQGNKNLSPEAEAQAKSMNTMNYMMMMMMGWFTWSQPAALGLYWVTGNIFRSVQQALINKFDKSEVKVSAIEEAEAAAVEDMSYGQIKSKKNKVVRK